MNVIFCGIIDLLRRSNKISESVNTSYSADSLLKALSMFMLKVNMFGPENIKS